MQSLITYGSCYGSAMHYAVLFAAMTGFPVMSYHEAKTVTGYDRVIHFGALYAGNALGLKHIVSLLSAQTKLIIVTVGLADVQNVENANHIKRSAQKQLPKLIWNNTTIYHLRGAIDYSKLKPIHRILMALLCMRAKNLPKKRKTAEIKTMLETYGKRVCFIDDKALQKLADVLTSL